MARTIAYVKTPDWLVRFMVDLAYRPDIGDVLEPACADAPFLREILSRGNHNVLGVDISDNRLPHDIPHLQTDFLLWDTDRRFDLIETVPGDPCL